MTKQLTRLPNGLQVLVIRDTRFPLVCTRLYVHTGSANEVAAQSGISHLLEHMVFKGTEHRAKGQVAKDVEALGGYLNATTGFDRTCYITDMPSDAWRTGMDVVKEMAFQAQLDPKELEAEKEVVISELEGNEDSPPRRLFEQLQTSTLAGTPYGRPIIGYRETVRATTAKDLQDYVKRWYQPQNMMLIVAGDVEPTEVIAYAESRFGQLVNTAPMPLSDNVYANVMGARPIQQPDGDGGARVQVEFGPWNKVYLGIAFPVPGYLDHRGVDLDVLAQLLGGDGTSRFYRKYQYEKQLVDDISVHNMGMEGIGLFTVSARMDPDKVGTFWQELTKDLAGLKSVEFKEEAMRRARYNIEDGMDRAAETLSGLTSWQGHVYDQLGGAQGEENMRLALRTVDAKRLADAIGDWIVPGRARVRVLAPSGTTLPDLDAVLTANWEDKGEAKPESAAATADQQETVHLGMGRTVILLPDAAVPYITLELKMAGGEALLAPGQQGLSELTARTLTDGCGTRDNQAMERFFADRAASVDALSSRQSFTVRITGPSRYTDDYLAILKEILASPRFEAKEVSREANEMKAALRQRKDSPTGELFAKLAPFLYSDKHPYGYDSLGTAENLDKFKRNDVVDFWNRQAAQPVILSVAGDIRRKSVMDFAASLPGTQQPAPDIPDPVWGSDRTLTLHMPGRNQVHYLELYRTVPLTHPDAPALMLLRTALSGQSGLLFSKLRDDQGLGYTVTSISRTLQKAGWLAFYIGTTPDRLEKARKGFATVVEDILAKPLPAEMLKAASNRMKGEYYRSRQSLGSRADEAAVDALFGRPWQFHRQLMDKAAALTPEDVHAVARRYLRPGEAYRITVNP